MSEDPRDKTPQDDYRKIDIHVTNPKESLDASHDIMVGLIMDIVDMERRNMIITGADLHLTFREMNTDELPQKFDGTILDTESGQLKVTTNVEQLSLIKKFNDIEDPHVKELMILLENCALREGWMSEEEWNEFSDNLKYLYQAAYDGDLDDFEEDVMTSSPSNVVGFNECFKKRDIDYRARKVEGQYRINRLTED